MPLRSSPGAILPRDMNERQWGEYAGNQRVKHYREGQTAYDTGTGFWIGVDDGTAKLSIGNSAGNKVTWNGTDLSIVGNLVLGSGNFLRSGQTAYDTGTGFWIGNDSGTPKLSVGNSAGKKLTWDGSSLTVAPTVQTFTPGWVGFGSAPSGDLSYISFGAFVILWTDAALTASLGAVTEWDITGLPVAIRPSASKYVRTVAVDDGVRVGALGQVTSGGAINMFKEYTGVDDEVAFLESGWTISSVCGLAAGSMFIYPTG